MLNVSSAVKAKFQSDLCRKELKITIGATVLTNEAIYKDGFKLTESVMDGTVEFVGCIASILEFKISTLSLPKGNYRGHTVVAEVAVYLDENTLSSYVPLFHGFVDECTKSADGYYQQFVCYDRLAYLSDEPGYNMYKAAFNGASVDLETFRDAIVLDCGMDAVNSQTLPNDNIIFKKRKRNKDVTAMALLRHIAQINGCFGILNRDNRFEFRQIDDAADPESIPYYRDLKYSDYVVRPVGDSTANPPTGSITIRTSSQDAGVTVDWTNYQQYAGTDPGWSDESQDTYLVDDDDADVVVDSYIIESNLIAYKLKASKKRVIGANILASLGHDAVFREYSVKCNGLPYVECCDKVLFTKGDGNQIEFVVTKRVLEGIQNMTDTYSCTITAQDANNKTFVSNVDNSTNSLGGNPDEALGLTEKTITVNGTYSALDDNAEGYSQVTVDVAGGGDLGGSAMQALAQGDIPAWSTVAVQLGQAQTAVQIQSSIPSGANVGFGNGNIYFNTSVLSNIAYMLNESDLTGTPETYKTCDAGYYPTLNRNLLMYKENATLFLENLMSGESVELQNVYSGQQNIDSVFLAKEYFKLYENNDPKLWSINPLVRGMGGAYGPGYPTSNHNSGYSLVRLSGSTHKYLYSDTYTYVDKTIDSSNTYMFSLDDTALVDQCILLVKNDGTLCYSGYYDVGYTALDLVTTVSGQRVYMWNAEGTRCFANLGTNGLAIFTGDGTSYDLYSNITNIDSSKCCMFSHYFWDGHNLWDLNSRAVMYISSAKNGGQFLGYVKEDYENNETGTAFILFS